jgi:hypothetical protein
MKTDQVLLDSPKENPQIPERIWSILEVMRGLKNSSREIPSTDTPSIPFISNRKNILRQS